MDTKKIVETASHILSLTTTEERECLARLASEVDSGLIVETGCLYGGVTAILALASPESKVVTIDNFSWHPSEYGPTSPELLMENLENLGIFRVNLLVGDSREWGKTWEKDINLLWIDGGHSYDFVFSDLSNFGVHAQVIALHDYGNPAWGTIKQAIDDFLRSTNYFELAEVVDTVAVLRRKKVNDKS